MFDISFFQKTSELKNQILNGDVSYDDIIMIEKALDQMRSKQPCLFNMETTNHCNMTCQMCPRTTLMTRDISWIDKELFESVLDQIEPHSEQSLEEFWNFVQKNYGITFDQRGENAFYFYVVSRCVILHGFGEPLVDKNIAARVQVCTDMGIPTYFSCVPANISVKRAESVMKAGLSVIKFSMDAMTDEQQKSIRGDHNDFKKSYQTMLDVIKMKKEKGYKTLIVPTMISFNEDEQAHEMHQQFLDLWKGMDVFAYVKSQDNRWYFEDDDKLENRSHYESQYCEFPWSSTTVMADGSVVPCTQDFNCEMVMGNVQETTLEEIWNGEKYKCLRNFHVTGDFPKGHKCNERCDQKKLYQRLAATSSEKEAPGDASRYV